MSKSTPHPSTIIKAEYTGILRKYAAAAEENGRLCPEQLDLIYKENWFKLLVPAAYGGLEVSLPQLVRLQEALSWADGSAGWVITLCAGAGWFGGFLQPEPARSIFAADKVCLAGSGAVMGRAEIAGKGYRINGTWKYASGAYHATHFTANCIIKKNGETQLDDKGEPLVRPFIMEAKDITLLPTWKYVGMVATGSHSFKADNVLLPACQCFMIDATDAQVSGSLYQFPFLQLAEATLAVNLSGMAVHFIDLCQDIFEEKARQPKLTDDNRIKLKHLLRGTKSGLQAARDSFFEQVDDAWENPATSQLQALSKTSRRLAITAREAVDQLYPYCGLMAASPDTEINRIWRDIHTAGQHSLLTFAE
jgi:alkylation response protein AidB-like acyl-CoA dehydrogenase